MSESEETPRPLTVREAGRLGGKATAAKHGLEFFAEIGRKGGQRVRELLAQGRAAEAQDGQP